MTLHLGFPTVTLFPLRDFLIIEFILYIPDVAVSRNAFLVGATVDQAYATGNSASSLFWQGVGKPP
jgi:hypothetical protein